MLVQVLKNMHRTNFSSSFQAEVFRLFAEWSLDSNWVSKH
jgi:hypothetical protein